MTAGGAPVISSAAEKSFARAAAQFKRFSRSELPVTSAGAGPQDFSAALEMTGAHP